MAADVCEHCGSALDPSAAVCMRCAEGEAGTGLASATVSRPSERPVSPEREGGSSTAALPLGLLAVIGLFLFAGGALIWTSLRALPDTFRLLSNAGFAHLVALALLLALLVIALLGLGLLIVARMLYRADRVGRGLAYVAAGTVAAAILFASTKTTGEMLAMFASIGAIAVLALSPGVRAYFTGPNAVQRDRPTSVVIAQVCVAVLAGLLMIVGFMYLLLGDVGGKYVFIGLALLGLAFGALLLVRRLSGPDRGARSLVSIGAVVGIILSFLGTRSSGFLVPLGIYGSILVCLWLAPDARAYFGDEPLGSTP
jgi:hypothetical protein